MCTVWPARAQREDERLAELLVVLDHEEVGHRAPPRAIGRVIRAVRPPPSVVAKLELGTHHGAEPPHDLEAEPRAAVRAS